MTTLQQIERKFNMFQRASYSAHVTEGEWVRYHRNHAKRTQAAAAVLRSNREQILGAVRDHFEITGYDRRIPYGMSGDGDCCPMACKFDREVDGGDDWPIAVRLFVAAFDRGVFPEFDISDIQDIRADIVDCVYNREAVYPPDEIDQVLVASND